MIDPRNMTGAQHAPTHACHEPRYTPKGSMCIACTHKARDCSRLAFAAMPMIERWPGQVVVRCSDFVKAIDR